MGSLTASLKRFFESFLKAAETRIDLFSLELQEEKVRAVQIILCACALIFFGAVSLIMIPLGIVLMVDPQYVEEVVLGFAIAYLLFAIIAGVKLHHILYKSEKPFSETIAQLKRDQNQFTS
ncbi:MAG: phage holin family protein [Verrucomicrobiota bacterium]